MRVLLVSKDLGLQGGIVNFVGTLLRYPPPGVAYVHVAIGTKRHGLQIVLGLIEAFVAAARVPIEARRARADLIHLNTSLGWAALGRDALIVLACRLTTAAPVVLFIHGWDPKVEAKVSRSRLRQRILRAVFGRCETLIVLASQFRSALAAWGFDRGQVRLMTTTFDGLLLPRNGDAQARERPPTLLFLARLVPEKGGRETLQAFFLLASKYPRLRLIVAGDGPEKGDLMALADARGWGERVSFPGYVRDAVKSEVFRSSQIFVLPTEREGCPVSLLEAMAAGLGVVTTRVGGIPDVCAPGVNARFIDDVEPRQIADAIAWLLDHPADLGRMQTVNKDLAWRDYEAARVALRLGSLYRSALDAVDHQERTP